RTLNSYSRRSEECSSRKGPLFSSSRSRFTSSRYCRSTCGSPLTVIVATRLNAAFSAQEYSRSAVVPIATRALALRLDAQSSGREAHFDRARRVGAKHCAAHFPVALDNVLARMAEAIAVADREHRVARRDLLDELGTRGRGAAVVGNEQHVRLKNPRDALQEPPRGGALDVPGEKHPAARRRDPQNTAAVVRAAAPARRHAGIEKFEGHSVPLPAAIRRACLVR